MLLLFEGKNFVAVYKQLLNTFHIVLYLSQSYITPKHKSIELVMKVDNSWWTYTWIYTVFFFYKTFIKREIKLFIHVSIRGGEYT